MPRDNYVLECEKQYREALGNPVVRNTPLPEMPLVKNTSRQLIRILSALP
jgi:hypothetical protein